MSNRETEALNDRIDELSTRITTMEATVKDVHDILTSFKMLAQFAKWITAVGAAGLFIYKIFKT